MILPPVSMSTWQVTCGDAAYSYYSFYLKIFQQVVAKLQNRTIGQLQDTNAIAAFALKGFGAIVA